MTLTSAWEAEVEEPEVSEAERGAPVLPRKEPPPHRPRAWMTWLRRLLGAAIAALVVFLAYRAILG